MDMGVPRRHSRVVIIGAGAVGSHLAASLRAEVPLLIVERAEPVREAYAARGIEAVLPPDPAECCCDPQCGYFRAGDVVVLATSAARVLSAAEVVPAGIPIVSVTNGLTPELTAIRNGSLTHGVVEFAVSTHSPGHSVLTREGCLTLQRQSENGVTAWLAAAFDPRLQVVRLSTDIEAYRYAKLMLNASLDPVAAVIGGRVGDVFRRGDSFRAFRVLLREALHVAHAAGWPLAAIQGFRPQNLSRIFATPLVRAVAAYVASKQAGQVASTLAREIVRGELGEAVHLCGAIAAEGARLGVATPAHARAMDVLRQICGAPGGNGGRPDLARQLLQR